MTEPGFMAAVKQLIVPVLEPHGFRWVEPPQGLIVAQALLESRDRWFAASLDWRERYLEASLGRLFLYQDVLPSVIVRGVQFSDLQRNGEHDEAFYQRALDPIARRLPELVVRFDELYPQWIAMPDLTGPRNKKARQAYREFASHLGPELTLEQFQRLARGKR